MENKKDNTCCEKFKTAIGGQALIEGIMMRGPEKALTIPGKETNIPILAAMHKLAKIILFFAPRILNKALDNDGPIYNTNKPQIR